MILLLSFKYYRFILASSSCSVSFSFQLLRLPSRYDLHLSMRSVLYYQYVDVNRFHKSGRTINLL